MDLAPTFPARRPSRLRNLAENLTAGGCASFASRIFFGVGLVLLLLSGVLLHSERWGTLAIALLALSWLCED